MAHPRPVSPPDALDRLLGKSAAMQAVRGQIRHLVRFDTVGNPDVPTVLLQGETGTGKGLVARIIHESGPRAQGPCIEVNCAAIPDTLLEAELFGFEAGAFSDAKRAKPGLFEAASRGTLFLDEIDALPLGLQGKLLTALESKRVRRLGAVREQAVDVKLIAAAQAELSEQVRAGRFRADLYHRLAVVVLALPPLRERGADVLVLAQAWLQRYAAAHRVRPKRLSPAAEAWLQGYGWPGNIRELGHLMERVTLLSAEALVAPEILHRLRLPEGELAPWAAAPAALEASPPSAEVARIRQALQETRGNVVQAAQQLGLSRGALRYRMARYGLGRAEERRPPAPPPLDQADAPSPRQADQGRHAGPEPLDGVPSLEEKPVAVLAIDLTFPPSPPLEVDGYEPWTVASRWEQALVEKVQGVGGVLVQRTASLFIMALGLPRTLEQLPQRAVQAALAIRQLVAEARSAAGQVPIPEVRQAIHLGPMLVAEPGLESPTRLLAVGETLSVSVRLLGHAAAGEIVVSAPMGRLVAGWCELRALEVSLGAGTPGPVEVYRIGGLVPRRSPLSGLGSRALRPFVGRARELAMLHELLGHVEEGRGQAVGIVGEAGVGKSRLLYEWRHSLSGRQVTYLEGRCLSFGSATPYLPVLELLRDNCGILDADGPEAIAEKVHLALQEVGLGPDEAAPYLLHLLGVQADTAQLVGLSPEAIKARTFTALTQLSLHGSRQQPLILAVEDVHWIDQTSDAFLAALVERLAGVPILLLVTYRPGYRPPWLGKSYATQLVLAPLASPDSRRLVQTVLQTLQLPDPLLQMILTKAEGNPLFLEELVQAVVEQGLVGRQPVDGAAVGELWQTRQLTGLKLPPTVQGVLAARIDRLGAEAKTLLQTLAVFGHTFSRRLLTRVVEQPEDELERLMAQLQAAEFLYERPAVPEPEYTFKHALTQEVAYSSLPREQRRALHERTARAIEALYRHRPEDHYSALAHHYSRSGNTAQAVNYLQRAGQQAVQQSAHVEAISHLTQGLALLTTLPETPARTQQELILQTTLGPALIATKGYAAPDVKKTYSRAQELCQQLGDTPQLFPVLYGLWVFYFARGELSMGRALGDQLLTLAQRVQDPELLIEAHLALAAILLRLGELTASRAHMERGIALYDPQQHHSHAFLYGQDPGVAALSDGSYTLWLLGYPDQALQRSQEAHALARERAHPFSVAFALTFAAWLYQHRGEVRAARERAEAAMALANEQGFLNWLGIAAVLQGWALAEQGQKEEGIAQMRQGLATFRATGAELFRPYFLALLAAVYGKYGQADEGLVLLAEALMLAQKNGERLYEAELYRLKGELLLIKAAGTSALAGAAIRPAAAEVERHMVAEAETCFRQALETARRQQAKSLELRAAMSLSRLWQRQGQDDDARQLLGGIYGWFTEGSDTADLQEAKALLEALS